MDKEHVALMIRKSVEKYGDKTAMRFKDGAEWKSLSYREMGKNIDTIAKGLLQYGIQEGDMVGIFSDNRPEWALADFGILSIKAVSVPIYSTNTSKQAEYIVNDAKIKILFVSSKSHLENVKSFINNNQYLMKVIIFDDMPGLDGEKFLQFKDFLKIGESASRDDDLKKRLYSVTHDDLATLIYTSGTTGDPKGVMLTHTNFWSQFNAIEQNFNINTNDKSLCFLPLSHAYERTWSFYIFRSGAENNYIADPKKIIEYLQEVKPTAMVSVPRLYEKIYSTVFDKLGKASSLKKKMFLWALKTGSKYNYRAKDKAFIGPYLRLMHGLANKLVLGKIRDVVGGPKNFFSAGGAPLSQEIEEFFFSAGLLVCQGYGLTETSPMISCNSPKAFRFGTVGKAIPLCDVRIGESGEIQAKGPNIMTGYFNKPESTAETIVDGWLKTGDVGIIDEDGFIKITDRIKDLIITSQGKNVAPQHVETTIGMDHYIEQIAVIGDKRNYVSALIVPSFLALEEYAKDRKIHFSSRKELLDKPEIKEFYKKRIDDLSKDLANYERVKRFTLMENEFTQDGGELTPTMKIKRKVVAEKYKDVINAMYSGE